MLYQRWASVLLDSRSTITRPRTRPPCNSSNETRVLIYTPSSLAARAVRIASYFTVPQRDLRRPTPTAVSYCCPSADEAKQLLSRPGRCTRARAKFVASVPPSGQFSNYTHTHTHTRPAPMQTYLSFDVCRRCFSRGAADPNERMSDV